MTQILIILPLISNLHNHLANDVRRVATNAILTPILNFYTCAWLLNFFLPFFLLAILRHAMNAHARLAMVVEGDQFISSHKQKNEFALKDACVKQPSYRFHIFAKILHTALCNACTGKTAPTTIFVLK